MNPKPTFDEIAALENELAGLAPLVRQGFDRAGGPSPRAEEAIRAEARRALKTAQAAPGALRWPRLRVFAAAAAFALLLGGSLHLLTGRPPEGGAAAEKARADESAANFANLLLDIQGLNEEGFFRPEEAESLWL
jgi:hypothetical protein